jgi:hypothetical protein
MYSVTIGNCWTHNKATIECLTNNVQHVPVLVSLVFQAALLVMPSLAL